MKKFYFLILLVSLILGSCSQNAVPELDKTPVKLDTPSGLKVEEKTITSTSMTVVWEALSAQTVAAYSVEYKAEGEQEFVATDVFTNSAQLTGLQHSTTYCVRLKAKSSDGAQYDSDYTDEVQSETLIIYVVTPPTNVRIVEAESTSSSIMLEWDAVKNAVGYIVTYAKSGTNDTMSVKSETTSVVLRNLEADTQYDIKVASCSRSGEEYNSDYCEKLSFKTSIRIDGIYTASDMEAFAASLAKEYIDTGVATGADWADQNGVVNIKANIDMTGISWTPIAAFSGVLDGNGFAIENLNMVSHSNIAALFAKLDGATVKNLTFAQSCSFATTSISELTSYVSTVAAVASNNSVLENITSYATLSNGVYMGGIVANADQKKQTVLFKNCKNYGSITYPDITAPNNIYIGGICSFCEIGVTFEDCANYGTITSNSVGGNKYHVFGGILGGGADHEMYKCTNEGAINVNCRGANNIFAAGMVGRSFRMRVADNCVNSGVISISESLDCAAIYVAGIAGTMEGAATQESMIYKCSNTANISVKCNNTKDVQLGGIMGWTKLTGCTISECSNSGNLTMTTAVTGSYVAGIATVQTSSVAESKVKAISQLINCKNTGDIVYNGSESNSAWNAPAGICGKCSADFLIEGCENHGNITANNTTRCNPAGIGSEINCDVVNCTNYGTVMTTDWHNDYYSGTAGIVSRYQQAGKVISGCKNYGTIIYNGKGFLKANANKGIVGQGGICGILYNGSVENCENYGTVLGRDYDSSFGLASYLNAKGAIVGWGGNNAAVTISGCKVGGAVGPCDDTTSDMGASAATVITAENYTNYIYGGNAKNGVTTSNCSFAQ